MKRITIVLLLFLSLLSAREKAESQQLSVSISNPGKFTRDRETLSIPWEMVKKALHPKDGQSLSIRDGRTGKELRYQIVPDFPESVIFQADFGPAERKSFLIVIRSKEQQDSTSLVDARYVTPREDLAWENDRIAFRMYGPALAAEVDNGIDVWTKRVRYLIVKKWYDGEEQTPKVVYHIDHGEGADFFNVGRSLGCGGSGIWYDNRVIQPGVFTSYKIIATGPIRACFELSYDNWTVNGVKWKETMRITIDAGQNLNKIEVSFQGGKKNEPVSIACGLVKRELTEPSAGVSDSWLSLWGQVNDSLPNGYLGTGIVLGDTLKRFRTEDKDQYLIVAGSTMGSVFTYYAGAGWTRSGDFQGRDDWNAYLDNFGRRLREPLKVTFSISK